MKVNEDKVNSLAYLLKDGLTRKELLNLILVLIEYAFEDKKC